MTERVVNIFDNITPKYDSLNRILSLRKDQSWRETAIRTLFIEAGGQKMERVLDACTGTGDMAIMLAERTEVKKVYGVDASRKMLDRAREKISEAGIDSRIKLVKADMFNLPFPDKYFDAITISFGLRNLHPYEKALREMLRVLNPGGHIAILEFAPPSRGVKAFFYRLYLRLIPGIGRMIAGDRSAYRYLETSIRGFLALNDMLKLLKQCGLRETKKKDVFFGGVYLYTGRLSL